MRKAAMLVALVVAPALSACSTCSDSSSDKDKKTEASNKADNSTPSAPRVRRHPRIRRPRISPELRAKRLQKRYKLSEDQTRKLEEVFDSTPRREQRAKMKEIFTDAQWQELSKGRNARRGLRRRNPERRAHVMQRSLGLSDEQTKKLVDILQNTPRKDRAAAFKKLLTPEQAKKWGDMRKRGRLRRGPRRGSGGQPTFEPKP